MTSEQDKKEYRGKSDPSIINLNGIVIGSSYEFRCEEQLVEERGSGKELTILNLMSYRLAD